jgi:lipoprotein-releasing system permease protein/zinc transport system substrate-binding protein
LNLSFHIAKRYLFSKKSHNAVHVISLVAICGVAIATMATVCTMSVFNGFQELISDMFSSFDPELKITPVKGKFFDPKTENFLEIYSLTEIDCISESLEDNVLVKYKDRQVPAVLKGISDNFDKLTQIGETLIDGEFVLENEVSHFAVLGVGIADNLGVNARFIFPLDIYAPKRGIQVNLSNPSSSFNIEYTYISGVFMVKQPVYDNHYLITSIRFARNLFNCKTEVSALEIKLKETANIQAVQKKIQQIIGEQYEVKNRYQQQEPAFKMMSIEKWVTFLMLCFILLIAAFNIVGSLSMLIVDKQKDIITLRNLGAGNKLISRIFLFEGWMISAFGAVAGIFLGILLCLGQQHFGWLQLGGGNGAFAVDTYPVRIKISDLFFVLVTVLGIGFLAVLYPVRYLSRKKRKEEVTSQSF